MGFCSVWWCGGIERVAPPAGAKLPSRTLIQTQAGPQVKSSPYLSNCHSLQSCSAAVLQCCSGQHMSSYRWCGIQWRICCSHLAIQLGNIYNTCWKLVSKQKRQCPYPHQSRPHQPHYSSSAQHATDVTHLDSVLKCSWAGRSGDNDLLLLAQLPGWQRWPIVWHFLLLIVKITGSYHWGLERYYLLPRNFEDG